MHSLLGSRDLGHSSEVPMVVLYGLCGVVGSRSEGNKASNCDQFVNMESSLLGLKRNIFFEAMNEV